MLFTEPKHEFGLFTRLCGIDIDLRRRHAERVGPAHEVDPRRLPGLLLAELLLVAVVDHVVAGVVEDGVHDGQPELERP